MDRHELVVVTGASSGIGLATAKRLATDGFHVLAGIRRDADRAKVRGSNIEPILLDIADAATIGGLVERIASDRERRPLRALVNNAGIAVNAPVEAAPLEDWRRQFEVGVIGQVAMIQALTPALLESRGRVVNIGSVGGKISMAGFGPYSAAKFAMEAVNDSLRREMQPYGLVVVMITPGAISTRLSDDGIAGVDRLAAQLSPEQHRRHDRLVEAVKSLARSWARDGLRPEAAAAVVSRAVTAERPRLRYTVGTDAALLTRLVRLIPEGLMDGMLRHQMKL